MHEMSITQAIVDQVEAARRQAGENLIVTVVSLKIGKFTAIVPDYVRHYFEMIAENTPLQGARLDIEVLPLIVKCRGCGGQYEPDGPTAACPQCGDPAFDILQGRELLIDSVELDEPE